VTDTDKDKEITNKEIIDKEIIDKETVGKETIPAVLSPKPGELTAKQRTFVNEYLVDLNGSKAAARAGYSPNHGYRLLYIPVVAQAIAKAQEERARRTEVTADRVVQQLARVAFVDMKDVVKWGPGGITIKDGSEVDGTILSEISKVSYKKGGGAVHVKLSDRMKALELLGRHLGMFADKVDVKIEGQVSFEDQLKALVNGGKQSPKV
jgi:phage terminase small subunit